MRAEEAERSPWSNVLVNAMGGGGKEVAPDIERHLLELGDKLLLCSDGLNKHLADDQIAELLERHDALDTLCDALIAGANNQGGTDNITVVIASCEPASPAPSLAEGRSGGLAIDSTVDGVTKPHGIGHNSGISWTDPPDTEPHDAF
jgi:protein phosphatase